MSLFEASSLCVGGRYTYDNSQHVRALFLMAKDLAHNTNKFCTIAHNTHKFCTIKFRYYLTRCSLQLSEYDEFSKSNFPCASLQLSRVEK